MYISLLERYNRDKHNKFPIKPDATMKSTTGVVLPTNFIVDIEIQYEVAPNTNTNTNTGTDTTINLGVFYVSKILHDINGSLRVVIAHIDTNDIATDVLISKIIDTSDKVYDLTPIAGYASAYAGKIAIGDIIDTIRLLDLMFDASATPIDTICINRNKDSVQQEISKVTFVATDGTTIELEDDFTIEAGEGIEFSVSKDGNSTVVTVTHEAETTIAELANAVKQALGNPITSINGRHASTAAGNIEITGDDCTRIVNLPNGIRIDNPCSTPCCSDADYSTMESMLNTLQESRDRLQSYLDSIATNINTMQARLSAIIAANKQ